MTEHEKELERMRERNKCAFEKFGEKPYTGRTDDIDITSEPLFCPNCGHDAPMKLNRTKTAVRCVNPVKFDWCDEYCEYEYALTAERVRFGSWWTDGFEYPLTRRDVLERRLKGKTNRLEKIPEYRKEAIEEFDKEEKSLTDEIAAIKSELESMKPVL
nr:hypothetical protein [uncultured Vibrio sp.]